MAGYEEEQQGEKFKYALKILFEDVEQHKQYYSEDLYDDLEYKDARKASGHGERHDNRRRAR